MPELREPRRFARLLREQAMADFRAAQSLRGEGFSGHSHAAVAKLQQALEKTLKGFLLGEFKAQYNPVAPHDVIRATLAGNDLKARRLRETLRLLPKGVRPLLEKLEALAPKGEGGIHADEGDPRWIASIDANAEYPFQLPGADATTPVAYFCQSHVESYSRAVSCLIRALPEAGPSGETRTE